MVSRPTVAAPPHQRGAEGVPGPAAARPHRGLVGVSVVCLESHGGRMIRAREAHQRLAAFRDLDTDGASVARPRRPYPIPNLILNRPRAP